MKAEQFLEILHLCEKLKNTTRHADTSTGRRESVAEHSWRLALMAFFLKEDFPDLNMDKVIDFCLIHDLGEAFTGDKPVFAKTEADSREEARRYAQWLATLPAPLRPRMQALAEEMEALASPEARLYKALDRLEALIQHNESPLESWLPLEYELQKTYAWEDCREDPVLCPLREAVLRETLKKIENGRKSSEIS